MLSGGFRHRPRPPKLNLVALLFNAPGDEMFTCRLVNLLPLSNSEINYVMLLNKVSKDHQTLVKYLWTKQLRRMISNISKGKRYTIW
ncbi:unnamed protein product [Brassica oleracea]